MRTADFCVIALDETGHWNIPEKYKPYVVRMEGVYLYDRNEHTFCCEFTPSYTLYFLENRAVFVDETPERLRDEIDNWKNGAWQDESIVYIHCHEIDGLAANPPDEFMFAHYGEVISPDDAKSYDDVVEAVIDDCRCNARI